MAKDFFSSKTLRQVGFQSESDLFKIPTAPLLLDPDILCLWEMGAGVHHTQLGSILPQAALDRVTG